MSQGTLHHLLSLGSALFCCACLHRIPRMQSPPIPQHLHTINGWCANGGMGWTRVSQQRELHASPCAAEQSMHQAVPASATCAENAGPPPTLMAASDHAKAAVADRHYCQRFNSVHLCAATSPCKRKHLWRRLFSAPPLQWAQSPPLLLLAAFSCAITASGSLALVGACSALSGGARRRRSPFRSPLVSNWCLMGSNYAAAVRQRR